MLKSCNKLLNLYNKSALLYIAINENLQKSKNKFMAIILALVVHDFKKQNRSKH